MILENEPVELYIIAGGFAVVSVIVAAAWIEEWLEARKERKQSEEFTIAPRRRIFRDRKKSRIRMAEYTKPRGERRPDVTN